jgi:hypothetical protein
MTWITFLTWASFFAAGGGQLGVKKAIATALAGALISLCVVWTNSRLGGGVQGMSLVVFSALLAFLGWASCQASRIESLSFIPGTFIGAAAYFGAGAPLGPKFVWIVVSLICGALMGLISEKLGAILITKKA